MVAGIELNIIGLTGECAALCVKINLLKQLFIYLDSRFQKKLWWQLQFYFNSQLKRLIIDQFKIVTPH